MTEVILQELNNSDIDWIIATATKQKIYPNTVLMRDGNTFNNLYLILEGTVIATLLQKRSNPLTQAFATLEGTNIPEIEIMRLSRGEIVGENTFTGFNSRAITITALRKGLVLSLPLEELKNKLYQEKGFAARFYRAIAILYLNRLQNLLYRLGRKNFAKSQPVRDVLYIFGQLHDSDLDWAIANGTIEKIPAQTTLIRQGGPVDALYFLLDGQMKVSLENNESNPLTNIFATLEGRESSGKEIINLHKGEIMGETSFIDGRSPYATVTAVADSLVLSLARPILVTKLQQDVGFAARFYQAISTLLADKLQGIISRLSVGRRTYVQGQPLNDQMHYEDEIDAKTLEQMSLAATRFDWMLERLKVG
ncbi:Cyclic nucleotide-binding protein [Hyella patelloides LEGE 07179]|uniref:Cyclic nucleotide-binding protein n=1 Tax=Hyella patelloides LEGE 07179 TaxID=945734 RepID=A0A563W547_9CYAN|nr:cyclic nucleotide-binding domain-containing protein [Hyella patelloides]VEP18760.1 Cyclic nucleotide-binding protein [Hyella patelloides LEGE 07179]